MSSDITDKESFVPQISIWPIINTKKGPMFSMFKVTYEQNRVYKLPDCYNEDL